MSAIHNLILLTIIMCASALQTLGQSKAHISFLIIPETQQQTFHISMLIEGIQQDSILLKMPAWTPGYYQMLNFGDNVSNVKVIAGSNQLATVRVSRNGWKFPSDKSGKYEVSYDVKAIRNFVATPFLDETHGYISPTGIYMRVSGLTLCAIDVEIKLPQSWRAATGLDFIKNTSNKFTAPDFDTLYDCPILIGPLEDLPSFEVKSIPHRFTGFNLGEFDKPSFMSDLKKVIQEAVAIIGDVPYKHYTFLAIGPGQGGIEHLNSTTFGFSAESMNNQQGKKRMYTFLAHEYFHHYNVKRIRPIELGPFDYDRENRTNMLWVSEGITVYYDELITRRAGLLTDRELIDGIRGRLLGYENKPGRLFQSATQASYNTWSDGPFGRSDDEINKTVSVYDKGAILGLMLDFNIRHVTQNKKSLDDVMRSLYQEFYIKKKRGFKEEEFQEICERIAGRKLPEVFEYAATVKPIDYKKYFAYGGLSIDTEPKTVPGAWLGISGRLKNDSLVVSNVEYESPGWKVGIRRQMVILGVDGQKITTLQPMLNTKKAGDVVTLQISSKRVVSDFKITLATKVEPDFDIEFLSTPTKLQKQIRDGWLRARRESK